MTEQESPTPGMEQRDEPRDLQPGEEPVVTGTLFLTLVFLMMIFGFWTLLYITLLNR